MNAVPVEGYKYLVSVDSAFFITKFYANSALLAVMTRAAPTFFTQFKFTILDPCEGT